MMINTQNKLSIFVTAVLCHCNRYIYRETLNGKGGSQSVASYEDLSSSSFSSASRASLDARSSPTPSYGAENMMVFPGDSSGSI